MNVQILRKENKINHFTQTSGYLVNMDIDIGREAYITACHFMYVDIMA
jgi:hypothetical protein